ncbi:MULTISPECIES: sensor histidine kinase [Staphylococcus]|uniref:sensor histidine kinase n=1 Tax=Staphylococcus TaxID=1279 RepID=UPI00069E7F62|nr:MULTISPECIES: HAMP domain-containing sensor histidine kinase [Staphylococcus]KQC17663.1 hypothetical protein SHTS_08695 [Staphylococcus haemolyticus]MBE7341845.1 HAMP domain-containing histidine kinase [Staphylococcus haemolyticus]OHP60506.1 hypothetical protein HMPREF2627_05745 [Staphylococcus sp. HMSC061F10]OHP62099.1 hypothetical protein HMPREF2729_09510 [Staphylococcus sp. HMSC061G04]PNY86680.1 sensor histidine kinase [Staphylococcus haemolyticus]
MRLLKKYYMFMGLGLLSIPLVFLAINSMILLCILFIEKVLGYPIGLNFKSSSLTIIFYIFFFLILITLVIIASRYVYKIVDRLRLLNDKLLDIANSDKLPNKLDIPTHINDEIDEVGQSINILIDRLRFRELEIIENKKQEQNYINQLAHDINTPLTALNLELYQLGFQYQINDNDIELSYEKINYISNLIKALPNKDDISKFYTFNHQVDIQACINTTIDKWHYLLDSKNILTILNVEGNRIYWLGDQLWYERLFDNIISNVYKHSNSSRITIYLNENYITIQDNGIGFNDMSTKSKGLTIIKDICERFSLKLNIKSDSNGTIITIENNRE